MKRKLFFLFLLFVPIIGISQSTCKLEGIVRYFYNDYFGHRPDLGAEVMIIKPIIKDTIPNYENWDNYQTLMDNWHKYEYLRKYFGVDECEKRTGFKESYKDSILYLSGVCLIDKTKIENRNLIKYTTLVDNTGKYSITIPYGTYYILIRSKNRKQNTLLEYEGRTRLEKIKVNSPTKIFSYDFDY